MSAALAYFTIAWFNILIWGSDWQRNGKSCSFQARRPAAIVFWLYLILAPIMAILVVLR